MGEQISPFQDRIDEAKRRLNAAVTAFLEGVISERCRGDWEAVEKAKSDLYAARHGFQIGPAQPSPEKAARDLLTTALETGGIDYWAEVRAILCDSDSGTIQFQVQAKEATGMDPTFDGWLYVDAALIVRVVKQIVAGEGEIARDIAAQFIGFDKGAENVDSNGADVAVQMAVFGQIVFS